MTSYKEEVFGPVASVIKVKDLDEAIRVANNSDF
jgi:acyl-CoA reductase-like NAD-dependent aldehyde dehydrogenase